jgi:quercetin dioxygenase-like cupin family protein
VQEPYIDTLERCGICVQHHFGGGVYAKQTGIPAGVKLAQHVHPHDHLAVLASGRVAVEVGGVATEHEGPSCIAIVGGASHSVVALTDAVWFCIHATRDTDPATVDTSILTGVRDD